MKKRIFSLILCVLIFAASAVFTVSSAQKETASAGETNVYYIETYEQLINYAKNAQSGCLYVLNADIEQIDNKNELEIVIPAFSHFSLDLNGYSIKRETRGTDTTLFFIKDGGYMKIMDTSENQTGYCSFSEGDGTYHKSVFKNEGGELEIINGYYEIFSPYQQGDCSVLRTTSGYTNIYNGTFDSSSAWGGDTVSVGHNAYFYETPHVNIFGGKFYGKYQSIDVSPMGNYLEYGELYPDGALHPTVYVLGGEFYVSSGGEDGKWASFAYCNNGWGRVIVAEGTVLAHCLNSSDLRILHGAEKRLFSETIDNYTDGYYEVTAPPMIMSENVDYQYRLKGLCDKAVVNSYSYEVYKMFQERFDTTLENVDTIYVAETEKNAPEIKLVNRTVDHKYIRWYMCNESDYDGSDSKWTYLGDFDDVSTWQFPERPEEGGSYFICCVITDTDSNFYEDTVRVTFEPVRTAEVVDAVEVKDVTAPAAGEKPDFDLSAEDSFYVNGIFWTDVTDSKNRVSMKETDAFEAGHTYELEVWIRANEDYKFRTDSDGWLDITASVAGKDAEVVLPGSAISAELRVTYTVEDTSTAPADPDKNGLLGDANEDGKVNIKDATAIQKHVASLITLSESGAFLADVDVNVNINIKDATAVQKHVAGMETGFDIGEKIVL